MRNNRFSNILQKIEQFPVWIKQALYVRLSENIKSQVCEKFIEENADDIFSLYKPTLTFKGSEELKNRKFGFDLNLYNFLSYCKENFSIIDIALNTFLTVEEVSKYFILCLEQGFIESPKNVEIEAMAGFLSGKFRTGEFFVKKGLISEEQLKQVIEKQSASSKKIAETLVDMGFVTQDDVDVILSVKTDSQKRYILDDEIPKCNQEYDTPDNMYKKEIEDLRLENTKLKQAIKQLLKIAGNHE